MMLVWTEIVKDQEVLQRLNIGRYFSDCHVKLELCIRFFFVSWIVAYIILARGTDMATYYNINKKIAVVNWLLIG